MSRTFKDRKGYKTRRKRHGYPVPEIYNYTRGGYDDYDHSDEELYVDDQCCPLPGKIDTKKHTKVE